jgi:ribosomal protein L19
MNAKLQTTKSLSKIPYFKKGSLLSIELALNTKNNIEQNIIGICTKKKYQGYNTRFVVKHTINASTVYQDFLLYSPFIKKISLLQTKHIARRQK